MVGYENISEAELYEFCKKQFKMNTITTMDVDKFLEENISSEFAIILKVPGYYIGIAESGWTNIEEKHYGDDAYMFQLKRIPRKELKQTYLSALHQAESNDVGVFKQGGELGIYGYES
jgi:hypothetical protein